MESASIPAPAGNRPRSRRWLQPLAFLGTPTALLLLLFLGPMLVMLGVAFDRGLLDGGVGFNPTLTNFTDVIIDPLYREVALTTFEIATAAMIVQLLVAVPLVYVIAFKAGRWQLPILLFLVLADELNPMVRIYAWRMLLGREGLINYRSQGQFIVVDQIPAKLVMRLGKKEAVLINRNPSKPQTVRVAER